MLLADGCSSLAAQRDSTDTASSFWLVDSGA